jgi:hypothetical protein
MRPLLLSLGAFALMWGAVRAQNAGDTGSSSERQLPVGQTFKQFEFPDYENGKLNSTLYATEATGITFNRAEAKNLKIQLYENGVVTTTITSPDADLYVGDGRMRTKNTVKIDRADLTATSQDCDFDKKARKYVLRDHVKVILKHFDISLTPAKATAPAAGSAHAPGTGAGTPGLAAPVAPPASEPSPGAPDSHAETPSAPLPPSGPDSK